MQKIVVVGGGASGLVAAIYAAKKGNEVVIIEKNQMCGKKILATGNGKCNYWNIDQNLIHYHSSNNILLSQIITEKNKEEVLSFFNSLGVIPKIKNGYYYPFSNQAVSIKNALLCETIKQNIKIRTDITITKIIKNSDKFYLFSETKVIDEADKVILTTGSNASYKIPDSFNGYNLAEKLGHNIIEPLPALVQLKAKRKFLKDWAGIRTDVIVSLYENNIKIKEEKGEIQLTEYGVSGICIFNLSRFVSRGLRDKKQEKIKINFLPFLCFSKIEDYIKWFDKQNVTVNDRTIKELLEGFLNNKLVNIILKETNIDSNLKWNMLSEKDKKTLIINLISFELVITKTNSYEQAQVCSGGVPLSEINLKTMESLKMKNLYFAGEILDCDGDCGGYNLSFAWISGMIAGSSCQGERI